MEINLSQKLKNILLIVVFLSVCFLCDIEFFSSILLTLFPHFTCNFEHSLGYYLYQTSETYRVIYNHRELTTCILGVLYFLFFRVYVFQKWITIIENKCQGLFLHDFLTELRKNKQILLYANIILLLITIVSFDCYNSALKINENFSFIFFFPFHYLILYIRWVIKDKKFKNEQDSTKKYSIIQYVNFLFISNFIVITGSSFGILLSPFINTVCLLYRIICFILILLGLYYVLYLILYYITHNIKKFVLIFGSISFFIILFICDIMYEIDAIDKILSFILATIYYSISIIGILSSVFINQISKSVDISLVY